MSLTRAKIQNLDTTVEWIVDPLVVFNQAATQANIDVGLIFNRDNGASSRVALYWNETTDKITAAYTSSDGLTNSNVVVSSYANIQVNSLFGNLSGGTSGDTYITGNLLPSGNLIYNLGSPTARFKTGYFAATTLDIGGSQISVDPTNGFKFVVGGTGTPLYLASNGLVSGTTLSSSGALNVGTSGAFGTTLSVGTNISAGGYLNVSGNILGAAGTLSGLTVNGNQSVTGYINTTGNVIAAVYTGGQVSLTGLINTAGNIISTGAIHNSLTINGATSATGFINTSANISASQGIFATINTTGLINSSANISASMFSGGQIYVSGLVNAGGNILAQSAIFNYLDVNGNVDIGSITIPGAGHNIVGNVQQTGAGTVFFNTPGNIMASVGSFGTVVSDGAFNTSGNVLATTGIFNTLQVNGNETITGYLNVNGNILATTANVRFANVSSNLTVGGYGLFSGQYVENSTIPGVFLGNTGTGSGITPRVGFFNGTQAQNWQIDNLNGIFRWYLPGSTLMTLNSSGVLSTTTLNASGNVLATAGTFNALTVNGNEIVTGYINSTGNVLASSHTGGTVFVSGYVNTAANVLAQGGIFNALTVNGNETVTGYLNVAGNIISTGSIHNSLTVNGNVSAGNISAVSLTTSGSNGNISGVNYYLGNSGILTSLTVNDSIGVAGVVYANSTTVGTSATSGAMVVAGGIGVGKDSFFGGNLSIAGNLFVQGNVTYFSSNNVTFNDSLIYLAQGATGDVVDIGIVGHFINPGYQHTGLARDASDGVWKLFANVVPEPDTTIDFTNATYSNLLIGNLLAGQATITGLNSAGFINTSGNVSAAIHSGGQVNVSGLINTAGNVIASGAVFNVAGVNGVLYANGTQETSSTTTGAIVVPTGGLSVGGNAYIGRNLYVGGSNAFAQNLINPTIIASDSGSTYAQMAMINFNASGSSDYGAYPSDYPGPGNDHGWADMGFTGTLFSDANYSITKPQDGYFFASGANASVGGNLVLATDYTGAYNDIVFGVGSFLNTSEVARFHGNIGTQGNLWIKYNTPAGIVNSATGALRVDGGVGIFGNLTAGSLTTGGSQHTLFGNIQINGIGFAQIPVGTTLQRPGTGIAGMIRFNTDTNGFEGYSNVWAAIGGGGGGSTPGGASTTFQYNAGGTALGGIATMNYLVGNGAIIISTGTASTSTATGALQIIGGVGITNNINAGGYVNATGNVLAAQVSAGSVVTTGVINAGGNLLAQTAILNYLDVNGNVDIGSILTPGAGHTIVGNVTQSGAGRIFYNTSGNIIAGDATLFRTNVNSTLRSVDINSGALYVAGGIAAVGNLSVYGNVAFGNDTSVGPVNNHILKGNVIIARPSLDSSGGVLTISSGFINSFGNVLATGGVFNALTVNGVINQGVTTANTVTAVLTHGSDVNFQLTSQNGYNNGTGAEVARFGLNYNTAGWDSFTQYVRGVSSQNGYQSLWASNTPIANVTSTGITINGIVNASGNILSTGAIHNSLTVNGTVTLSGGSTSINLTNATSNRITWGTAGVAAPTFTAYSAGVKLVLYDDVAVAAAGYTIGIESSNMFFTVDTTSAGYKWYAGTTSVMTLSGAGVLNATGGFSGTATTAKYADLAENYVGDKKYVPGTVVVFGGSKEVTISTQSHDPAIAGVISTDPGFLMNGELTGVAVALQGRVPCRVQGPVKKGDRVVSSSKPGVACRMDKALYEPGCIIGKALEDILDDRVHTIEVVVGRV